VTKLLSTGELDTTFGADKSGIVTIDSGNYDVGNSLQLDNDGNIYVTGWYNNNIIVIKLKPDGSYADDFGEIVESSTQ
jgi:hypothetical protein